MATIRILGFETGDDVEDNVISNGGFAGSAPANVTVQTTNVRSGTYSCKVTVANNTQTSWYGVGAYNTSDGTFSTFFGADSTHAKKWVRFYFLYTTKAASNSEQIAFLSNGAPSTNGKLALRLNSDGTLSLYGGTGGTTLIATGTSVLQASRWYCIEFYSTNSTSAAYEVRLNFRTEMSGTANHQATEITILGLGKGVNHNSQPVTYYYDDVAVSNSDWPGPGQCRNGKPTANGSTMQYTNGTGSSDYTQVDELTPDTADYVKSAASANQVALFAMQDPNEMGVQGIVACVAGVQLSTEDVSVTSSNKVRFRSGSTNSDTTAVNLPQGIRGIVKDNDPATSNPWKIGALSNVEIGGIEANAVSIRMHWVAMLVDFQKPYAENLMVGSGVGF